MVQLNSEHIGILWTRVQMIPSLYFNILKAYGVFSLAVYVLGWISSPEEFHQELSVIW
jgi:hypothetical protein